MNDISQRIVEIEKELRETPHHKATDHHIGRMRAKLAQLKEEQLWVQVRSKGGGGGGYSVRKSGDATVVLVGPPSVGKSSLLNALTDANSAVAEYDFTTLNVIPGMMNYNGAKIQIFDVPGIIEGAATGKGRGKEVLSVARSADLLILMVDVRSSSTIPALKKELEKFGFRLGDKRPQMTVNKKTCGGLKIVTTTPLSYLSRETIKEVAQQFRISNAEIIIRENLTLERLIDGLMPNRIFIPYLIAINKVDLSGIQGITLTTEKVIPLSVKENQGLEELRKAIWEKLGLIRIYLKAEISTEPDFREPLILRSGSSIVVAAEKISAEMAAAVKTAQVWGESAKFPGQRVSLKHCLQDEDVLLLAK